MKLIRNLFMFGLLLGGCFLFGFTWRDIQSGRPSLRAVDLLLGVKSDNSASPEEVFKQTYNRILTQYDGNVKPKELKYAGMEGLMASLGDPHTMFLPPQEAQEFSDQTKANFFGVGARLKADPAGAYVANVFEDGPAYAAGLRSGNLITGVNGKSVGGIDIDSIVDKIKGPEGTSVKLTVIQSGKSHPVFISIVRAKIITPTVESKYLSDYKVGYMSIAQFSEPTTSQFDKELAKLEKNPMKGLIIDLRGNPGGLLSTAQDMLSRFVEDKVVVRMHFRDGHDEVARTYTGSKHEFDYPIVCLINEDSASAAEIFSGCLRDYGKATLVGEHSYGKASVQNVIPLVDNSSAKITIAKYFLPGNEFIGRKVDSDGVYESGGLEPSVKVDLDMNHMVEYGDPKTDNQLVTAIQVVLQKTQ
jgi:carboxyl-terminal processing protease